MSSDPSSDPRGGRRPRRAALDACLAALLTAGLAASLAAVLLPLAACGKKGEPLPPLRSIPRTTDKLVVSQRGHELILQLPYPTTTSAGQALEGLERVEVYRLERPVPESDRDLLEPDLAGEAALAGAAATEGEGESGREAGGTAPGMEAEPEVEIEPETEAGMEAGTAAGTAAGGETGAAAAGEMGAEARAEAEAAAAKPSGPDRATRLRQLLAPRSEPELRGAELVTTVAADDLTAAVVGGDLVIHLPLADPLPAEPQVVHLAVRTVGSSGEQSAFSNQAAIVPLPPPPPPRGLDAEARSEGIRVSWEPQTQGIVGYNLYRREATLRAFENPVAVPTPDRTSYLDRTAKLGGTYVYAVTAVVQRQPLVESAVAQVQEVDYRDRFAPPVPQNLVALAEEGRVRVVWEGSEADDLAGYLVSRRSGPDGDFEPLGEEPRTDTEYVDTHVEPGTRYTYRVVAVDTSGNRSEAAEATTEAR